MHKNVCSFLLDSFYHRRNRKSTERVCLVRFFEWLQPFNANSSQPLEEAGVFFAFYDKFFYCCETDLRLQLMRFMNRVRNQQPFTSRNAINSFLNCQRCSFIVSKCQGILHLLWQIFSEAVCLINPCLYDSRR